MEKWKKSSQTVSIVQYNLAIGTVSIKSKFECNKNYYAYLLYWKERDKQKDFLSLYQQRSVRFSGLTPLPLRDKRYELSLWVDLHFIQSDQHLEYMFTDVMLLKHRVEARVSTRTVNANHPNSKILFLKIGKTRPCGSLLLKCVQRLSGELYFFLRRASSIWSRALAAT